MNFLNAIDNILDRAFVPQHDEETATNNTGSSIWSEGASSAGGGDSTWDDEDEELTSNASLQTPNSGIRFSMAITDGEEDETGLSTGGAIVDTVPTMTFSDQRQPQTQSNRQLSPFPPSGGVATPGIIRPGKLRMMPKRQISSSSEGAEGGGNSFEVSMSRKPKQESDGTENPPREEHSLFDNEYNRQSLHDSPPTNQLLTPTPLTQEDSLLHSRSVLNNREEAPGNSNLSCLTQNERRCPLPKASQEEQQQQQQRPQHQQPTMSNQEAVDQQHLSVSAQMSRHRQEEGNTNIPPTNVLNAQHLTGTASRADSTAELQPQRQNTSQTMEVPEPSMQDVFTSWGAEMEPTRADAANNMQQPPSPHLAPTMVMIVPPTPVKGREGLPVSPTGQVNNDTQSFTSHQHTTSPQRSQQLLDSGTTQQRNVRQNWVQESIDSILSVEPSTTSEKDPVGNASSGPSKPFLSSKWSWSAASSVADNTDDENDLGKEVPAHMTLEQSQVEGLSKTVIEASFLQQEPAQSSKETQQLQDENKCEDDDVKYLTTELAELQILVESASPLNESALPTQPLAGIEGHQRNKHEKVPSGLRLERTKTQQTSNRKHIAESTAKLLDVKPLEIDDGEDTTLIESSTQTSPALDSRTSNDDSVGDDLLVVVDNGFGNLASATESKGSPPVGDGDVSESPSIDFRRLEKTPNDITITGPEAAGGRRQMDVDNVMDSRDENDDNLLSNTSLNFLEATRKPPIHPPIVEPGQDDGILAQEKGFESHAKQKSPEILPSPAPFEVSNFLTNWDDDPDMLPQPVNCYGAFHVRLLRAQRLPCPVGSTVHAVVSLLPWKGRFRTERKVSFLMDQRSKSSFDHGVCVQWDDKSGDAATISLIHAYASESTPMPTVKIELMLSPVKMLEFSMCSLNLPCDTLMSMPGMWRRQWFLTEMQENQGEGTMQLFSENQIAMVQVEALFVPDDQYLGSSFVSINNENKLSALIQGEFQDQSIEIRSSEISEGTGEASIGPKMRVGSSPSGSGEGELSCAKKSHLLRITKFWKPATCAVCSSSLMGFRTKSFRCEACGVDCCSDCFQHVDVQLPCGSDKAKVIVRKAIQNKLTVSRFLEAMAPVDESYEQKKRFQGASERGEDPLLHDAITEASSVSHVEKKRIGVLKLNVIRACVFRATLSSVTEPNDLLSSSADLQPGDYYVRVCRTGTFDSVRTRTIPSAGKLKFEESNEIRLDVAHYGVDFFIEVVDAHSDKIVGTSVITSQGILQQQRDIMIEKGQMSVLTFVGRKPPAFKGKQRMLLELRTGVKSGVSSNFFVPSDSKSEQGEISGWVELVAGLEEDIERLYGPEPYACPAKPPDALNLNTLNLHISRIGNLIEDIGNVFSSYKYMVSWRNPLLTGFSFVFLISFCIRFNAEYVGSLPFFFLIICMLRFASSRSVGYSKARFEQEEAEEWMAAERDIDVKYTLHRPVSTVSVGVTRGKHIRSREMGLAGNVGCRVYWDPLRYASDKKKEKLLAIDKSTGTTHEIGCSDSKFTVNPTWSKLYESAESRRLKQVLPHRGHFFESELEESEHAYVEFPVLQPFRKVEYDADNTQNLNAALEPWSASPGAVVFQVHFRDILNMLPGSDQVFGEVAIPLSQIVERREISGWFPIMDVGTKEFVPNDEDRTADQLHDVITSSPAEKGLADAALATSDDNPQILLTVKWSPPEDTLNSSDALDTEREASVVIQEELLRWTAINREKGKLRQLVVGGSIGAFRTVSGLAGTLQVIQNFLGSLVDMIESVRNALNFTDPYKSSMLLAVVSLLWLLLSLVPTRAIVLIAVVAQYALTLKSKLQRYFAASSDSESFSTDSSSVHSDDDESEDVLVWLMNAIRGLPTDEDLRKTYFWAARRIGARKREKYASEKRMARLKRLWKAKWHATVKIRRVDHKNRKTISGGKKGWVWETVFALVQGRRFLWWRTVRDFDNGETPLGRIFLAGHAGLCGLSPLEMREIDPKEVPLVAGIFGRGLKDQERLTILLPSAELKEPFENAVIDASIKDD